MFPVSDIPWLSYPPLPLVSWTHLLIADFRKYFWLRQHTTISLPSCRGPHNHNALPDDTISTWLSSEISCSKEQWSFMPRAPPFQLSSWVIMPRDFTRGMIIVNRMINPAIIQWKHLFSLQFYFPKDVGKRILGKKGILIFKNLSLKTVIIFLLLTFRRLSAGMEVGGGEFIYRLVLLIISSEREVMGCGWVWISKVTV